MSWSTWHEQSEHLASKAHVYVRQGDLDRAMALFGEAAEAENQALLALEPSKVRTFGITAVSAASLWFKARQLGAAERNALRWLASDRLPQFAVDQLRGLLQAIWTEQAMRSAGVAFLPGQVVVSVKGVHTITGGAPLDLIVEKVQTVQALFYRTIEFLKGVPHRKRGVPALEIQEACRPWLLQAPSGSYQFSVAVQEPAQADFFRDAKPNAEQVAQHFMSILKASSEDPAHDLPQLVPANDYRVTFLKLARNLSPTGKNFSQVEVRSAGDIHGISLGPESRRAINRVLRPPRLPPEAPDETEVELRGVLRALDLERDWLEILTGDEPVRVMGLNEAVDDIIGPMVNRPVIVQAKKQKKGGHPRFVDIEIDD